MSKNKYAGLAKTSAYLLVAFAVFIVWGTPAFAVDEVTVPSAVQRTAEPIIGGSVSANGGQPWIAALVRTASDSMSKASDRQFCGGTLVAARWVLTAAHCVSSRSVSSFQVIVGREDLDSSNGEVIDVIETIVHPYWSGNRAYDVAMLRLKANARAEPVKLVTPSQDQALTGTVLDVHGWGYRNYVSDYNCTLNFVDAVSNQQDYACKTLQFRAGTSTKDLVEARVKYATYQECDTRFRAYLQSIGEKPDPAIEYFSSFYTPQILCGWHTSDSATPCFGDSGGPLTALVNGQAVLVGVVTGGVIDGCSLSGQIGMYAKVTYLQYFIDEAMQRTQSLGFAALCPASPVVSIGYESLGNGKNRVRVTWEQDANAQGYRLFYSTAESLGNAISKMELPATTSDIAVTLSTGQLFHVALQAKGAACDSPISAVREVKVP